MSKSIKVRTRYKIVGSDYSAQEPRLTAFMSQDPNMLRAYEEGKDLYCVIAQAVYDNNYEDNLEFVPEGYETEIDGKKIVSGSGQEKEISAECCEVPYFYLISTKSGEKVASEIVAGESILLSNGNAAEVKKVEHPDEKTVRILVCATSEDTIIVKSPPRIQSKAGKERRSAAKTLLLAMLYGMSAATAGKRMGKTTKEGQELFDNFFAKFPSVKQLIENSKTNLRKTGFVEDWAGRRRRLEDYFLDPYSAEYVDKEKLVKVTFNPILGCKNRPATDAVLLKWITKAKEARNNQKFDEIAKEALAKDQVILTANTGRIAQAERQCLNARIQGGAASLTKLAMVNIFNDELLRKYQAKLIITVHDEVLVECPAIYAEEVEKRLPEVMVGTAKPYFNVPMKCDPYNVQHWYEDEYTTGLLDEFDKLHKKLGDARVALQQLSMNHPEFTVDQLNAVVTTGEVIKFD